MSASLPKPGAENETADDARHDAGMYVAKTEEALEAAEVARARGDQLGAHAAVAEAAVWAQLAQASRLGQVGAEVRALVARAAEVSRTAVASGASGSAVATALDNVAQALHQNPALR